MVNLSIITVNLNNAYGLLKTIQSVVSQSYSATEYIIIDGNSTDESVSIIKQYEYRINFWLSESDRGIYHAMNKGIKAATGEYVLFLNSGDWLVDSEIIQSVFSGVVQADIIAGDIYFYDTQNDKIQWCVLSPDRVTARHLFLGTLPHQATFIRRRLFETIGLYSEQLVIASDWLFFLEALLVYKSTYHHYAGVISYFNMNGISCNPTMNSLPRQEQLMILEQKYPLFLPDYEYFNELDKQNKHWLASREYQVYKALDSIGVIKAGVFCRRLKRAVQRNVTQLIGL